MDVQTYLEQFDISRRNAKILHTEYDQEMKMIESILSSPYFEQRLENNKDMMIAKAKARELKDLEQKELKICNEIRAVIDQIPGVKGDVLHYRYIDCDTWEQIADKLCYSLRNIHRLHKLALEELQNILD